MLSSIVPPNMLLDDGTCILYEKGYEKGEETKQVDIAGGGRRDVFRDLYIESIRRGEWI